MSQRRDLVILGGGLVGMTLALAAARQGITSHVVDKARPEDLTAEGIDGRASAISTASWNLFCNIGLEERLAPLGCPIEAIAVTDQMRPGRIDFRPQPHEGTLGRMYANRDIRLALFEAAKNEPLIDWRVKREAVFCREWYELRRIGSKDREMVQNSSATHSTRFVLIRFNQ